MKTFTIAVDLLSLPHKQDLRNWKKTKNAIYPTSLEAEKQIIVKKILYMCRVAVRLVLAGTVPIFRPCPARLTIFPEFTISSNSFFLEVIIFWDENQDIQDRFKVKSFFFRDHYF